MRDAKQIEINNSWNVECDSDVYSFLSGDEAELSEAKRVSSISSEVLFAL